MSIDRRKCCVLGTHPVVTDRQAHPITRTIPSHTTHNSSKVAITIVYRSGKKDEVLGVAAPGQNLWSVGAQPPMDRWLPIATKEGIYAGELNFHIHWTKTEVRYRKPVQLLQAAAAKTQPLTAPVEPYLENAVAGAASLGSTLKTKVRDVCACTAHTHTYIHDGASASHGTHA